MQIHYKIDSRFFSLGFFLTYLLLTLNIQLFSQDINSNSGNNTENNSKVNVEKQKKTEPNPVQNQKSFVVVIPSYQNHNYFQKNLDSVFSQDYENYRVIYIDDASPDNTAHSVKEFVKEKHQNHRFTLIQNAKREGSLANLYKGIQQCDSHEIVVNLDGDDWLAHDKVLSFLNEVYANPNIWVTYGQFKYYPSGEKGYASQIPEEIIANNSFRNYGWVTTALRTFYAGLFQKIKKEDLQLDGRFFNAAGDLAYMWPIVEMSGRHSQFISKVLYIYNIHTSIRDVVVKTEEQKKIGQYIKNKKRYLPVSSPF